MSLHPDEPGMGIYTRWVAASGIAGCPSEPSSFLTVESDDVVLIVHLNLVFVPHTWRELLVVLIVLLPRSGTYLFDLVNGTSSAEEGAIGLVETRIPAGFLVDLYFITGMYPHKCCVICWVYRIGRWIRQARVTESNKDAGVIVRVPSRVRQQEVKTQNEIFELLRCEEEQTDTPAILLGDDRSAES